jgi:hypothetical protein
VAVTVAKYIPAGTVDPRLPVCVKVCCDTPKRSTADSDSDAVGRKIPVPLNVTAKFRVVVVVVLNPFWDVAV